MQFFHTKKRRRGKGSRAKMQQMLTRGGEGRAPGLNCNKCYGKGREEKKEVGGRRQEARASQGGQTRPKPGHEAAHRPISTHMAVP